MWLYEAGLPSVLDTVGLTPRWVKATAMPGKRLHPGARNNTIRAAARHESRCWTELFDCGGTSPVLVTRSVPDRSRRQSQQRQVQYDHPRLTPTCVYHCRT